MTFDEWLNEIENYSARWERLNEDVDFAAVMCGNLSHNLARKRMYVWLEAAYNVGKAAGVASRTPVDEKRIDELMKSFLEDDGTGDITVGKLKDEDGVL